MSYNSTKIFYWPLQKTNDLASVIAPDFTHPDNTVLLSLPQTDTIVLNKHEDRCKKTEREWNAAMLHMVYQDPSWVLHGKFLDRTS